MAHKRSARNLPRPHLRALILTEAQPARLDVLDGRRQFPPHQHRLPPCLHQRNTTCPDGARTATGLDEALAQLERWGCCGTVAQCRDSQGQASGPLATALDIIESNKQSSVVTLYKSAKLGAQRFSRTMAMPSSVLRLSKKSRVELRVTYAKGSGTCVAREPLTPLISLKTVELGMPSSFATDAGKGDP